MTTLYEIKLVTDDAAIDCGKFDTLGEFIIDARAIQYELCQRIGKDAVLSGHYTCKLYEDGCLDDDFDLQIESYLFDYDINARVYAHYDQERHLLLDWRGATTIQDHEIYNNPAQTMTVIHNHYFASPPPRWFDETVSLLADYSTDNYLQLYIVLHLVCYSRQHEKENVVQLAQ
jgi:hypothetical protein